MIRLPFALALLGSLPHLAAARQTLGLSTGNKKPNQLEIGALEERYENSGAAPFYLYGDN